MIDFEIGEKSVSGDIDTRKGYVLDRNLAAKDVVIDRLEISRPTLVLDNERRQNENVSASMVNDGMKFISNFHGTYKESMMDEGYGPVLSSVGAKFFTAVLIAGMSFFTSLAVLTGTLIIVATIGWPLTVAAGVAFGTYHAGKWLNLI